jgi:hypothetical protein
MTGQPQDGQKRQAARSRVERAWADLPLRAKGLVVIAIPLLALLLATVLFGVALAQDRRAQGRCCTPWRSSARSPRSASWSRPG